MYCPRSFCWQFVLSCHGVYFCCSRFSRIDRWIVSSSFLQMLRRFFPAPLSHGGGPEDCCCYGTHHRSWNRPGLRILLPIVTIRRLWRYFLPIAIAWSIRIHHQCPAKKILNQFASTLHLPVTSVFGQFRSLPVPSAHLGLCKAACFR